MAHVRDAKFETPTARRKLKVRKKPYKVRIARGIKLLYRRNQGAGTWSVEASDGHGKPWTRRFAEADDHDKADGNAILTFWQAQDRAKALARGQASEGEGAPATVSEAIADYERELENHGADPANAKRIRRHLSSGLAARSVALLSVRELRGFRDSLIEKGLAPGGVVRTTKSLKAALNAAAAADPRIANNAAWRIGLAAVPVGDTARRMVLQDADVGRIVTAAYQINPAYGLYIETSAVTGSRPSQIARLTVADLQGDRAGPRLMMPASRKGGRNAASRKASHKPIPVTTSLAKALLKASLRRPADALLLVQSDGTAWDGSEDQRQMFRQAVTAAGLGPDQITPYALRHSSIVRMLLRGLPVSLAASLHDTSATEIHKHYGRYVTDIADDLARGALLDLSTPAAGNVLPHASQS